MSLLVTLEDSRVRGIFEGGERGGGDGGGGSGGDSGLSAPSARCIYLSLSRASLLAHSFILSHAISRTYPNNYRSLSYTRFWYTTIPYLGLA